jgi:putative transposase
VRRHYRRQAPRRLEEQSARAKAVAYARTCSVSYAARALGVPARTLRHWRRCGAKPPAPRGRPPSCCSVADHNEVVGFLHQVTGPSVGLPALRRLFPNVLPCILTELITRYRRMWRRRYRKRGFQLDWRRAGTVWAIDHSKACHLVVGVYPYLFAVRDLGGKCQLAWHPCRTEQAEEVIPVLDELFQHHAPPLVLKSDNGSAFIAETTIEILHQYAVEHLRSPPRIPSYNGALERSNGTLKTYTQLRAIREGHPLRWTTEDLEEARQLDNAISRPWGYEGPTPEEAWDSWVR